MFKNRSYIETYFSTYTILYWKKLLENDVYKSIILNSLKFLVANKRVLLYGYVIMPNHIHLIWHISEPYILPQVQRDFLKFTGQQILFNLKDIKDEALSNLWVGAKDRNYQVWERSGLSVKISSQKILEQKLKYIHNNPLQEKWNLAVSEDEYKFSSSNFYLTGIDDLGILTHYAE